MTAATMTRPERSDTRRILLTLRAEALFASTLQPSESPSPHQVQRAVAGTLRRLGVGGCAAHLAGEVGDHPTTAAARMRWALALVHAAYQGPSVQRRRSTAQTADGPTREHKSPAHAIIGAAEHVNRGPVQAAGKAAASR
jgi:hypothetical protein